METTSSSAQAPHNGHSLTEIALHFLYDRIRPDTAPNGAVAVDSVRRAPANTDSADGPTEELAARLAAQEITVDPAGILARAAAGRAAAAVPGAAVMSVQAYDRARTHWLGEVGAQAAAGERAWPPTSQTVMKHLGAGRWNPALAAAGLPTASTGRPAGATRFSAADYDGLMVRYAQEDPAGSFTAFSTWLSALRSGGGNLPSPAAVRRHYGSWSAARAAGGGAPASEH
ncbi:hypothetical protein NQ036_00770 [Brevibacterium sp. 91QC2O2]|uniref:hypothetical protein n=1 Tax=Brevibacterium TaxID=1696 RepID=UPI00211C1905|nr:MULTISPECIES: hypothetical protein [unclassified Brevibacterium]MCQ9366781.1 hypothetical protein [Brevibacterium sp. 91QC2O2]MCQ9383931.1 hypothetical protein [Brevibacterium sp. 68QC2CO]